MQNAENKMPIQKNSIKNAFTPPTQTMKTMALGEKFLVQRGSEKYKRKTICVYKKKKKKCKIVSWACGGVANVLFVPFSSLLCLNYNFLLLCALFFGTFFPARCTSGAKSAWKAQKWHNYYISSSSSLFFTFCCCAAWQKKKQKSTRRSRTSRTGGLAFSHFSISAIQSASHSHVFHSVRVIQWISSEENLVWKVENCLNMNRFGF